VNIHVDSSYCNRYCGLVAFCTAVNGVWVDGHRSPLFSVPNMTAPPLTQLGEFTTEPDLLYVGWSDVT